MYRDFKNHTFNIRSNVNGSKLSTFFKVASLIFFTLHVFIVLMPVQSIKQSKGAGRQIR